MKSILPREKSLCPYGKPCLHALAEPHTQWLVWGWGGRLGWEGEEVCCGWGVLRQLGLGDPGRPAGREGARRVG